jgi:hypothetical protein
MCFLIQYKWERERAVTMDQLNPNSPTVELTTTCDFTTNS